MRARAFAWNEANTAHIARHGVDPLEVEEAFEGDSRIYRARAGRYLLFGRSASGRSLVVVFSIRAGVIRAITAREMTRAEKRRHK